MTNLETWPLRHFGQPRAWTPGPGEALAVPLLPSDKKLTWGMYLDRLKSRVKWMTDRTENPQQVYESRWYDDGFEIVGLEEGQSPADHLDSPEFTNLLANRFNLTPSKFPREVKPDKTAIEEILTVDNLDDWLMHLLPGLER